MTWLAHTDPDFVWSEMMAYWVDTGQLSSWDHDALSDEAAMRSLGYEISYGQPLGTDPQNGPNAPWSPWIPDLTGWDTAGDDAALLDGVDPLAMGVAW